MRDANRAPPPHDRVIARVAGNRGRGQGAQRRPLLGEARRRRPVAPVRDDLLDEGVVRGDVVEGRMAPHEQRLRDQRLQPAMRLLGDAVFMRAARRDPARAHPVVLEHGAKARRQIAPTTGFQLVGRGRQIVAAQDGRHAAERPQRALHAGDQRLERFAERDRHPRPVAVTEHELEEQVRKRIAGDRHAEVGRVREVDRRLATGHGDLLEEHLGLDAVPRPPVAKAPLQRPRLARRETAPDSACATPPTPTWLRARP